MFDAGFFKNPYPTYKRLRAAPGRIHHLPGIGKSGGWLVPRYDDVVSVLDDAKLTSARSAISFVAYSRDERSQLEKIQAIFAQSMMFLDAPDHTRWRRVMLKAFTKAGIDELWPVTRTFARQLLDSTETSNRFEFVADYANMLPIYVVAHLLGAEIDDHKQFAKWAKDISIFVSTSGPGFAMAQAAQLATIELFEHLRSVIAARARDLKQDAISEMIRGLDTLGLTPANRAIALSDSLPAHCVGLLVAGHETSSNLIGNALYAIFANPSIHNSLIKNPALAHTLADELSRYDSSVQILVRVTKTEGEMFGKKVGAGEVIMALVGSANRDETKFTNADAVDPSRRGVRSLTFGSGRHYCPGAQMGLMELGVAIEELFCRFPRAAPDVELDRLQWRPTVNFRGLSSMLLTTS